MIQGHTDVLGENARRQTMSDLIERDRAIAKTFCTAVDGIPRMVVLLDDIKAIPSARPKGDWVSEGRIYPPTNGYHGAVCSICGTESEYLANFCGECGADMREDEPQTECDNDCPYRVDGLGCMRLGGCYKESE